jgi:hypothetical protein
MRSASAFASAALSPQFALRMLRVFALGAFVLATIVVRVVSSARAELSRAEQSLATGDQDAALVHLRRAARWYAPASPYHVRALEQLAQLGQAAEARGDNERALNAYRSLRGAIMATRSFYMPEPARLLAANQRIAALMAELPPPGMDAGKTKQQLRAEHLALLLLVPGPNLFWTSVLLIGFACWVGSAFAFSVRAIDDEDRWVAREVRRWGALIALGFGLFVLGMVLV